MASQRTRSSTEHSVVGSSQPLPIFQVPTSSDVFRRYENYLKFGTICTECTLHERSSLLTHDVKKIYDLASIPTIEFSSIVKCVERLVEKVQDLGKYSEIKKSSSRYKESVSMLQNVFDVCFCKCFDKGARTRSKCQCPLQFKILQMEWDFWVDQKSNGKLCIRTVDKEATSKLRMKETRRIKKQKLEETVDGMGTSRVESHDIYGNSASAPTSSDNESSISREFSVTDDSDSDEEETVHRNRKQYPELCRAVDRCKISNRDTCLIVNAALKDLGILSAENCIDPTKLRRQRKHWRDVEIKQHCDDIKELVCLGFDGKCNITMVNESGLRRNVKEELYVIVSYPDGKYVDHVMPDSSKFRDVAKEILSVVKSTQSFDSLLALICDGTVVNTGKRNGVIRLIEGVGRPLQWLVCMLHMNELPLRKYISFVDGGRTTDSSTSTGEIASALNFDPKDLPIVEFRPVQGKVVDVPDNAKKDLRADQKYFLRASLAVQEGISSTELRHDFQHSMPSNLSHARWLTKANRILRLHMSRVSPSKKLNKIV